MKKFLHLIPAALTALASISALVYYLCLYQIFLVISLILLVVICVYLIASYWFAPLQDAGDAVAEGIVLPVLCMSVPVVAYEFLHLFPYVSPLVLIGIPCVLVYFCVYIGKLTKLYHFTREKKD